MRASSHVERRDGGQSDDLFRVTPLPACVCAAGTIGCLATAAQWLLLGTTDGRILFFHVSAPVRDGASSPTEGDAVLAHTHAMPTRQPVSQLIVLRECRLILVRAGDTVTLYRAPAPLLSPTFLNQPPQPQRTDATLAMVAQLTGLADLIAVHVRKQRQLYTLALLHRRKLGLYDLRDVSLSDALAMSTQSVRLVPIRDVALPDGVRCFEWCGKNAILGFRRSYVYLQLSSGATEELGQVGSAAEPFLRSMHPAPEVLVGHDGVCQRTLPDGTAAPGRSAFSWSRAGSSSSSGGSSAPTTAYCHPFLCSLTSRAGGAKTATAEFRMPLLTTLPPDVAGRATPAASTTPSTVCGKAVRLPCDAVVCVSHNGLDAVVDLDGLDTAAATSSKTANDQSSTAAPFSLDNAVVVASDKGSVLLLVPTPVRTQGMCVAADYGYQAAELLCELSAARATSEDRQLLRTLAAIESFTAQHYPLAMQQLSHAGASPVVAVALFADVLSPPAPPRDTSHVARDPCTALVAQLPGAIQAALTTAAASKALQLQPLPQQRSALTALQSFLLSNRVPLRREVTRDQNEALLRCVDTALVQSYAVSGDDEAIIELLHDAHYCDRHETEQCLLSHGLWAALAVLWQGAGDLDKPLQLFRRLATHGVAPSSAVASGRTSGETSYSSASSQRAARAVFDAFTRVAAVGSSSAAARTLVETVAPTNARLSTFVAESTTPEVQACLTKGAVRSSWPLHVSGLICALAFVHQLSWAVEAHVSVLRAHVSWLLGLAPLEWVRAALLGTLRNAQHYDRLISTVRTAFDPSQGWRSALEVETSLLFAIVEDERLHCTDADVHNACWRSAALLVFTGPAPVSAGESGAPSSSTTTGNEIAIARDRLDRFLGRSGFMDAQAALRFFEEDELREVSVPERSILYQRVGDHENALAMFLYERRSVSAATQYALHVHDEQGDDEPFSVLLRMLAHPRDGDGAPRTDEIIHILRSCPGVNVADALPLLPDSLNMTEIGPLLLRGLRDATTEARRDALCIATLCSRKNRQQQRWVAESATTFTVTSESMCAVCQRSLRAESVFLRYPNGVLAHPTCVTDEHICPVTHTDFTRTLTATLLTDQP